LTHFLYPQTVERELKCATDTMSTPTSIDGRSTLALSDASCRIAEDSDAIRHRTNDDSTHPHGAMLTNPPSRVYHRPRPERRVSPDDCIPIHGVVAEHSRECPYACVMPNSGPAVDRDERTDVGIG
jgi:hypothetical protein